MSDTSPDKQHAESEAQKQQAAESISPRGARHFGGDPELARVFAEWDGE